MKDSQNGHSDASLGIAASNLAAMFGDGADAQADLSKALVRSTVQLTAEGMREAVFITEACGPEGVALVNYILEMKNHQNPGAGKKLVEAIKALSLFEHLRGFNLNLGGK